MSCSFVWLKDDFRTSNNQAITALIEDENKEKRAIYIYEKEKHFLCEAQRWWLARSLEIFKKKLENLNISLDVIHDNTEKTIKKLVIASSFNRIYWNKSCHINENIIEQYIKKILEDKNIFYKEFEANLLNPVEKIKKDDETPYKVFTHYWKKAEQIYLRNNNKNNKKYIKIIIKILRKIKILQRYIQEKNGIKNLKNIGNLVKKAQKKY
jgi:deoxyribodipyrimidine photo-lyase